MVDRRRATSLHDSRSHRRHSRRRRRRRHGSRCIALMLDALRSVAARSSTLPCRQQSSTGKWHHAGSALLPAYPPHPSPLPPPTAIRQAARTRQATGQLTRSPRRSSASSARSITVFMTTSCPASAAAYIDLRPRTHTHAQSLSHSLIQPCIRRLVTVQTAKLPTTATRTTRKALLPRRRASSGNALVPCRYRHHMHGVRVIMSVVRRDVCVR